MHSVNNVKSYFDKASDQLKASAPNDSSEALQWFRQTATSYAGFIPGAKGVVDSAFNDIDAVRNKHGDEVDKIVRNAYNELKEASNKGLSLDTAQRAGQILQKYLGQIAELAGDAASDILDNHPQIKEKVGPQLQQLKSMGEAYGPEAKKQVDRTWEQIKDIMKSGVSMDTANKIKNVVQEKVDMLKKMGDQAWQKGLEQAKPFLDKNPKIKQMVEDNAESLKQGNAGELFQIVKQAVESGDTTDLQNYVRSAVDKTKQSSGGGIQQYLHMIPGGDKIVPRLTQLQEIAQKHGHEAEKLMKETIEEVQKVLERKGDEAQKLAEKASKDAK